MGIDVRYVGPLFTGETSAMIAAVVKTVEHETAEQVLNLVQQNLQRSLKHPTGHYQRAVGITNRADSMLVTDGGIVYGPWLEGVGTRNQTTRFKGYAAFRRAAEQIDSKAGRLAQDLIGRQLGRMS